METRENSCSKSQSFHPQPRKLVGDIIPDSKLAKIALKGFTKKWKVFVECIVGREKLLNWSRLWDDLLRRRFKKGL